MKYLIHFSCLLAGLLLPGAGPAPAQVCPDDVIVDDGNTAQVEITAYWKRLPAAAVIGPHGESVLSDEGLGVDSVVRLMPELSASGRYEVYLYWPALPEGRSLATNASVRVRHASGSKGLTLNQRDRSREWVLLGTFDFQKDGPAYVEIRNDAADGVVLADAARFRPVP